MAIARRSTDQPKENPKKRMERKAVNSPAIRNSPANVSYALPTARSTPSSRMMDYTWLIYGAKGIGKTTLASRMDSGGGKVLFAMFEPGGKALSIFKTPTISRWSQFQEVISHLETDKQGFDTIVIDPGSIAYKRCLEHVCAGLGITHPGAVKDYGASWDRVNTEFQEIHSRIAALDMGFIVLAHDRETEIERRGGSKFHKTMPVMSGSTEEFYAGVVDIIAHYEYAGDERFLRIRGDEHCEAKCRLDRRFLTTTGEPIVRIPMGRSMDQAYQNLTSAFENKQRLSYAEV